MSEEYKFSHQFSQRWLSTPQKVRAAIVHELEDIIRLLDSNTDLNNFEFHQPELPTYIDQVYAEAEQQKQQQIAAQQQAEQLKQAAVELEQTSTDDIIHNDSTEAEEPQEQQPAEVSVSSETTDSEVVVDHLEDEIDADSEGTHSAATHDIHGTDSNDVESTDVESTDVEIVKVENDIEIEYLDNTDIHTDGSASIQAESAEDLILALENRIDDYLSEQMAQLSEDLKSWLRDEVKRHLDKQ